MPIESRSNEHAVLGRHAFWACLVLVLGTLTLPAVADVHLSDTDPATGTDGRMLGATIAYVPDLNSDGFDEILVGVPGDARAGLDTGAVFFWYGGLELTEQPDRIWTGLAAERLGSVVAHVGDLDDDGFADFAVGAPWYNGKRGRVLVFYGKADIHASGSAQTRADDEIIGPVGGDQFGFSVEAAGNFNGDSGNYADMIVGSPWAFLARGTAFVIYGSNTGVSTNLADATALIGRIAGSNFGWSVSAAGNFLGGNESSVAVGAPVDPLYGLDAGAVFVYEGSLGGADPDTTIDKILRADLSNRAGSLFGYVVRGPGSWDGDSYDDLAVGAPGANAGSGIRGRAEILFGGTSPAVVGSRSLDGLVALDSLGYCLDWVFDPGSNDADLLVGAPYSNADDFEGNGTGDGGRAYRWLNGDASGDANDAVQLPVTPMVSGAAGGDHYGFWVASAGDVDGDGLADLVVGAPTGNIATNALAGYVHLMDTTDLVVPNLLTFWRADWAATGGAELTFALDPAAGEVAALQISRRDAAGTHLLWTGPALSDGAEPTAGLVVGRDGYRYLDPAATAGSTYQVTVILRDGSRVDLGPQAGPAGGVPDLPGSLELGTVWPNPANPLVTVSFRAPAGRPVSAGIHDIRGRLVRRLAPVTANGAWQEMVWDGNTDDGLRAASGVYLLRLGTGAEVRTTRLTLAR